MRYRERLLLSLLLMAINFFLSLNAQEAPKLKIGGALRFNYNYSDWKPGNRKRFGDFGFDVFRLNVDAAYRKILLSAEYRFYPSSSGGGMLKQGWLGYKFNDEHQLQVGLTGVPFGIQPYTSNSYFFNVNYYVGLEDDADMGLKYLFQKGNWNIALAFFKNSDLMDFGDNSELSPDRYGYDVGGRNKEVNQGNIQVLYHCGKEWKHQFGLSALMGGLYNLNTQKMGNRAAYAIHYVLDYKRWNLKAQYSSYCINAKENATEDDDKVVMVAYGSSYQVTSEADIYTVSLAYKFPINKLFLDEIRLYNDFSLLDKRIEGFNDSYQNVTGCSLAMGNVFAYLDYAVGKNHAWFGRAWDDAFAEGVANKWNARFNVNIGYYF